MNSTPLNREKCPSIEELSAFFDGESSDPEISLHLAGCPSCRARMTAFSEMESAIRNAVARETGTDGEISERILSLVRKSLPEKKQSFFVRWFPAPVLWRAACLFLIVGITGYFTWNEYRSEHRKTDDPAVSHSARVPATISPVNSRPVQISDLSGITFSSDGTASLSAPGQAYASIPDYVRHVWTFSGDVGEALRDIPAKAGLPDSCVKKTSSGYDVSFKGSKIQAVRFVRACGAAGFRLLSPDQPQPEQSYFAGSADAPVLYSASFPVKETPDGGKK